MEKVKSKRGRKPKNKINETPFINNKIDETLPIIVHLPIQLNEDNSCNKLIEKPKKKRTNNCDKEVFKIELDKTTKCWWCRYNFNTERVELPENYFNECFYCTGNFCSYNCAAAYNIELNDENVFKRQSLLHLQPSPLLLSCCLFAEYGAAEKCRFHASGNRLHGA